MSERHLDHDQLQVLRSQLEAHAPDALAKLGPGAEEDEIVARFAAIGTSPSSDAITWWTFWNQVEHDRCELVPGVEFFGLEVAIAQVSTCRATAREIHEPERGVAPVWPSSWVPFAALVDGRAVLDCWEPSAPSAVRRCFWDEFSGPQWGEVISPSLASWLAGATDWIQAGHCHYDAEKAMWCPPDAVPDTWPRFPAASA